MRSHNLPTLRTKCSTRISALTPGHVRRFGPHLFRFHGREKKGDGEAGCEPLRAGHLFFLIVLCYLPIRTQPPVRFHAEMESALADGKLSLTCFCRWSPKLVRIAWRTIQVVRPKRRDLIHIGIQHANVRCISAPARRKPDGPA